MIRKYHNHKLQSNPLHRKEEPHNYDQTPRRQTKQSNKLSLPHQDDCKTRKNIKSRITKHTTITESRIGSNTQQRINNNRTTNLEWTVALSTVGLKCTSPKILLLLIRHKIRVCLLIFKKRTGSRSWNIFLLFIP